MFGAADQMTARNPSVVGYYKPNVSLCFPAGGFSVKREKLELQK